MFLLILDDGHGEDTAGKRTPTGIKENQFNAAVVEKAKALAEARGIKVLLTAPEKKDIPLKTRTDRANVAYCDLKPSDKCVMVSVHYNAHLTTFEGSDAKGVETLYTNEASKVLAEMIHSELIKGTKQVDRKVKMKNLHMTREGRMPSVLIECGFMDDLDEAGYMLSELFQNEVATEVVRGVCKYFSIPFDIAPSLPSYKIDGIKTLFDKGLLNDYEGWLSKIDEPLPAWATFAILANLARKAGL